MTEPYYARHHESLAAACPMRWLLTYGLGIRPRQVAIALRRGTLWHDLMHTYWRASDGDAARAQLDCWRDDAIERIGEGTLFSVYREPLAYTDEDVATLHAQVSGMLAGYVERWADEIAGLELIASEADLRMLVQAPVRRSTVTGFGGRVDKVVRDGRGQVWVLEHKTSARPLDEWYDLGGYSPQTLRYACLVRAAIGIAPVGVVYDLASTRSRPAVDAWSPIQSGKRMSKVVPEGYTAEQFIARLAECGFGLDDEEWYRDALERLERNPPERYRWEWIRFGHDEIRRQEMELYATSTALRRMAEGCASQGAEVAKASDDPVHQRDVIAEAIRELAGEYPRQGDCCYGRYGSPCSVMAPCQMMSPESLEGFDLR